MALAILRNLIMAFLSSKEQYCIVIKFDELRTLCDQPKTCISESSRLHQKLVDVVRLNGLFCMHTAPRQTAQLNMDAFYTFVELPVIRN